MICHACGAGGLSALPEFVRLPRVASDCRPWPAGGALVACPSCGLLQKAIDPAWQAEAARIYASYHLYHQSAGGTEQVIFDQHTGTARPRSELLLRVLREHARLPDRGRLLDMGCGSGPTLRAFARLIEGWTLVGYDPHLPDRQRVLEIPGVAAVIEGGLEALAGAGPFDVVSAVHVLEHVVDPVPFLRAMAARLSPAGLVLLAVPHFPDSAFDLMVADHCSHFTEATLRWALARAGLEPLLLTTGLLPKEITVIARRGDARAIPPPAEAALVPARAGLRWLAELEAQARGAAGSTVGVFGTSIGGNWLLGVLGDRLAFFVDEDPARVGRPYRDRPVVAPDAIPEGSAVLMPLPRPVAEAISRRLQGRARGLLLPPPAPPPHAPD